MHKRLITTMNTFYHN